MGVWIEIYKDCLDYCEKCQVTPFMGVWIEILFGMRVVYNHIVTPFMGVWIEIIQIVPCHKSKGSHTLYGCVD